MSWIDFIQGMYFFGGVKMSDTEYMKLAIKLAKKGAGYVNPNPMVGAVIVKDNRIIGQGYHEIFGGLHAERNGEHHVALVMGDLNNGNDVLCRVHSECLTGDAFGSLRCDCGQQLDKAMKMIAENGSGVLLYMRQEGRGIGLVNKLKAYHLQDNGMDTLDANLALGFQGDLREYYIGAQILRDLGIKSLHLLTNNPDKVYQLEDYGMKISSRVPIEIEANPYDSFYLKTKKDRMGHILNMEEK